MEPCEPLARVFIATATRANLRIHLPLLTKHQRRVNNDMRLLDRCSESMVSNSDVIGATVVPL